MKDEGCSKLLNSLVAEISKFQSPELKGLTDSEEQSGAEQDQD